MWKPVPGYEEYYECSDNGNIRSLDRYVIQSNGMKRLHKGRELKATLNKNGYLLVPFSVGKKRVQKYVHRLVAETYLGNIKETYTVNHIDGDKRNNQVSNLEIISVGENNKHAYEKLSRMRVTVGCRRRCIRAINTKTGEIAEYKSVAEASRILGLSETQIRRYLDSGSMWGNLMFCENDHKCVEDIETVIVA
ncbi:MAG: NUMOD4 domain-containing protein [Prevotella copri]|nr:NUMOD4 domain-containing protein [Segatella copri]